MRTGTITLDLTNAVYEMARANQVLFDDLVTYLQKCRCMSAVLVAALNRPSRRHVQKKLHAFNYKLEKALSLIIRANLKFTDHRHGAAANRIELLSNLDNLYCALHKLAEQEAKKQDVTLTVIQVAKLFVEFQGLIENEKPDGFKAVYPYRSEAVCQA